MYDDTASRTGKVLRALFGAAVVLAVVCLGAWFFFVRDDSSQSQTAKTASPANTSPAQQPNEMDEKGAAPKSTDTSNSTSSGSTSTNTPSQSTSSTGTGGSSSAPTPSTTSPTTTNGTSDSTRLANTGPGDVVVPLVAAVAGGMLARYWYLKRQLSR